MFEITSVSSCPYARQNHGRMYITTEVWRLLAGACKKEVGLEWGAYLMGTRSKDGWTVVVTHVLVPTDQVRTSGHVDFPEVAHPDGCVGAVHSHHSMGAFWSGTDREDINKKFPTSIVLSTRLDSPKGKVLGVEYKAVGSVILPCGSLGSVEFQVIPCTVDNQNRPTPVKFWPEEWIPSTEITVADEQGKSDLGDCNQFHGEQEENSIQATFTAKCGLSSTTVVQGAFGFDEETIPSMLPASSARVVDYRGGRTTYRYQQGIGLIETPSTMPGEYDGHLNEDFTNPSKRKGKKKDIDHPQKTGGDVTTETKQGVEPCLLVLEVATRPLYRLDTNNKWLDLMRWYPALRYQGYVDSISECEVEDFLWMLSTIDQEKFSGWLRRNTAFQAENLLKFDNDRALKYFKEWLKSYGTSPHLESLVH